MVVRLCRMNAVCDAVNNHWIAVDVCSVSPSFQSPLGTSSAAQIISGNQLWAPSRFNPSNPVVTRRAKQRSRTWEISCHNHCLDLGRSLCAGVSFYTARVYILMDDDAGHESVYRAFC